LIGPIAAFASAPPGQGVRDVRRRQRPRTTTPIKPTCHSDNMLAPNRRQRQQSLAIHQVCSLRQSAES